MDLLKIGKYIQAQRKAAGMTQKQLAQHLNVSFQAVSKWENGDAFPDTGLLLELADALQTTVDSILTGGTVFLRKRRRIHVSDVVEGFEHIKAIGRCFGETSTFYTGMIEGINHKMNIDIISYLNNPQALEAMIAEVLIQAIMNGYTLDMDEVKQYISSPNLIRAIDGYLLKTQQDSADYPLQQAAEGYRNARAIKGDLLLIRMSDGEIRVFEPDSSDAIESDAFISSDKPIKELLYCGCSGTVERPSDAILRRLKAAHPENTNTLVFLQENGVSVQKRVSELI